MSAAAAAAADDGDGVRRRRDGRLEHGGPVPDGLGAGRHDAVVPGGHVRGAEGRRDGDVRLVGRARGRLLRRRDRGALGRADGDDLDQVVDRGGDARRRDEARRRRGGDGRHVVGGRRWLYCGCALGLRGTARDVCGVVNVVGCGRLGDDQAGQNMVVAHIGSAKGG